jgi:hypothetical protein
MGASPDAVVDTDGGSLMMNKVSATNTKRASSTKAPDGKA